MATHPYHRLMQHFTDQELYKWLWEVVMFLHLHQVECVQSVMDFTSAQSTSAAEHTGVECVFVVFIINIAQKEHDYEYKD